MTMTTEVAVTLEENKDSAKIPELERCIKEYIELEAMVSNQIAALAEIKNSLLNGELKEDSNLVKLFERRLDQLSIETEANRKHPKYREFRQKVWQVHHPGEALPEDQDSDLVIASNTSSSTSRFICPLTRTYLEQPMKNRNCGHHYSKEAIEELLKKNKKNVTSCPVAGCSAKVIANSIEEDPDMERQVVRFQKKNKEKSDEEEDELEEL